MGGRLSGLEGFLGLGRAWEGFGGRGFVIMRGRFRDWVWWALGCGVFCRGVAGCLRGFGGLFDFRPGRVAVEMGVVGFWGVHSVTAPLSSALDAGVNFPFLLSVVGCSCYTGCKVEIRCGLQK